MRYEPRRAWPSIEHLDELGFHYSDSNPAIYGNGCAACCGPLPKRRRAYCSDECASALQGRIYFNSNWIRRAVVNRRGAACAICGEKLSSPVKPSGPDYPLYDLIDIDHIVPLVEGGTDHADNLQVLCKPCHKTKSAADARRRSKCLHMELPVATPPLEGLS